jgi:hypothetical protein
MKKRKQSPDLVWGEYVMSKRSGTSETAAARREFGEAVRRVLPVFFEQLREQVYPTYARLAADNPNYWQAGWRFATWQANSDHSKEGTSCLLAWARKFHAEQDWVLESALQTLWVWHKYPALRESLDVSGFRCYACEAIFISGEERHFRFEDEGWEPQVEKWAKYSSRIRKRFDRDLCAYEVHLRALVESRGAVRARSRYRADHFKWFALYQLGGLSTVKILKGNLLGLQGDESTIRKGVKAAADLRTTQYLATLSPPAWGDRTSPPPSHP